MSSVLLHCAFILVGSAFAIATLPGTLELLFLTLGACLSNRRKSHGVVAKVRRLFVVVPAHNEELHIERCVRSVSSCGRNGIDVQLVVVADNCTDRTAELAQAAGARVLERSHESERGKGFALHLAFQKLLPEEPDAFVVVDADSEVAHNFINEIGRLFERGADAVQARYLVRNGESSLRNRLMRLASFGFNIVRPRGRDLWGLSAGIYGNGFALSSRTVRAVPYLATSVVEDLEYHLALVRSGRRVFFADRTAVYADIPASASGLKTQRARWEGGRFRMIAANTVPLLREIARGNFRLIEPLLDLLLLPLAFHVLLLTFAVCVPFAPSRGVALFGFSVVVLNLIVTLSLSRSGFKDLAALASVPFYVMRKACMLPGLLRNAGANAAWIRTERVKDGYPT